MPQANKTIRLESGRFVTTKVTFSTEQDLAKAKPDEIWTDGDGRRVIVREMETRHITNAMRSMEKHYRENLPLALRGVVISDAETLALLYKTRPIYGVMAQELAKRARKFAEELDKRARGISEPETPKGRKFDFEL